MQSSFAGFFSDFGNRVRVATGVVLVITFAAAMALSAIFPAEIPAEGEYSREYEDDFADFSFWSLVDPAALDVQVVRGARFGMTMMEITALEGSFPTHSTEYELEFGVEMFGEPATMYYSFVEERLNFCGVFFDDGISDYRVLKNRFDAIAAALSAQYGMEPYLDYYRYDVHIDEEVPPEQETPTDAELEEAVVNDRGQYSAVFEFEHYTVTVHLEYNVELERPEVIVGYELML